MSCSNTNSYLFEKNQFRISYLILGSITFAGLFIFSAIMFSLAYYQEDEKLPCFFLGLIFAVLDCYYGVTWVKNLKIMQITYTICKDEVMNQIGTYTVSVRLDRPISKKVLHIPVYIGKGKMILDYQVITNAELPEGIDDSENLYKTIASLLQANCVLLSVEHSV